MGDNVIVMHENAIERIMTILESILIVMVLLTIFLIITVIFYYLSHKMADYSSSFVPIAITKRFKEIKIDEKMCNPLNNDLNAFRILASAKHQTRSGDWEDCLVEIKVDKEFYKSINVGYYTDFSERTYPIKIIKRIK